jgi:hypothetical protein
VAGYILGLQANRTQHGSSHGSIAMHIKDLSLLSNELIHIVVTDSSINWKEDGRIDIQYFGDEFHIRQGDAMDSLTVQGSKARFEMQVQREKTIWVLKKQKGVSLYVQSLEIFEEFPINMSIAVGELIAEDLYKTHKEIGQDSIPMAIDWLNEIFIANEKFNSDGTALQRVFIGQYANSSGDSFQIFGDKWVATIRRDHDVFKLIKLSHYRNKPELVSSIIGIINFQDIGVIKKLQSAEQQALLDAALRNNGSYLSLWNEYGKLEWDQAKYKVTTLGALRYTQAKRSEGEKQEWLLTACDSESLKNFKRLWRELEIDKDARVELTEREPDFESLGNAKSAIEFREESRTIQGTITFEKANIRFQPEKSSKGKIPISGGYMTCSIAGNAAVKERRDKAKQSIDSGRRLPQLRYLLEGIAPPSAPRRHEYGLTPYAKASFKGEPTDKQKLALEVAINTPDIALIVGPPGTGKTQVIAALQRRLASINDDQSLHQLVLISSYQHDAVDNALDRTQVYGLPAIRIGGKDRTIDPVKNWCINKQKEISKQIKVIDSTDPLNIPLSNLSKEINSLRHAWLSEVEILDKLQSISKLLKKLYELNVRVPSVLKDQLEDVIEQRSKLKTKAKDEAPSRLLRLVRSLRITEKGFMDDGSLRVFELLREITQHDISIENSVKTCLQELESETSPSAKQIEALAIVKSALLDKLIPDYRPLSLKNRVNQDTILLLNTIERAIEDPLKESKKGIPSIIRTYGAVLVENPKRTEAAVREYANVVGATCQGSAGRSMSRLQVLSDLDATEGIEFDTVIIDEAARANPLDLFVPMSMAKRRIILVGDHRQLPHLLQQELENELATQKTLNEMEASALKTSLFERLVGQLREQEKTDNIKRVVMLDKQYRMHPVLGKFISENFYERYDEDEILAGRPASDFMHDLPGYEGRCCAWLDIPIIHGQEAYRGKSRIREAEAKKIAYEVKRIADAGGKSLSIGVISFYRAQCDIIMEELQKIGLAEEEDGKIKIANEYRNTEQGEERVLVGTVDSFQGKEFDVVFLSLVRSNDYIASSTTDTVARDKQMTKKYGHLRLDNRLNVAMSRQRKLLILAGDRAMAKEEAKEAVPALVAFSELCYREQNSGG